MNTDSIRLSGEVLRGMKEKALQHGYQTTPCLEMMPLARASLLLSMNLNTLWYRILWISMKSEYG